MHVYAVVGSRPRAISRGPSARAAVLKSIFWLAFVAGQRLSIVILGRTTMWVAVHLRMRTATHIVNKP